MSDQQRFTKIEKRIHELEQLLNAPRKQYPKAIADSTDSHQEQNDIGQNSPVLLHGNPTETHANNSERKWYNSRQWWKSKSFQWYKNRFEIVALIAGIGYAFITYFQWRDLRHNFEVDERAWVGIKSMDLTQLVAGKVLMGDVKIVNSGKTLALNETHPGSIQTSRTGLQEALATSRTLEQPDFSPNVLFPGIDQNIPSSTYETLDDGQIAAVLTGALQVFLIGDIRYDDVFGKHHTTHYCGKYRIETKRFETCGIKAD